MDPRAGTEAIGFGPCGLVEIGALRAEGSGVTTGWAATAPRAAAGAAAYGTLSLGAHVDLLARADLVVPILRSTFLFRNVDGPVFQPSLLSLRTGAGVEYRF